MPPVIIRYPLDPTGVNPDNLVLNEVHPMVRRKVRAIATTYGAFYTESLVVIDVVTQLPLEKGRQYFAAELYEVPTGKFGKEVCAIIILTDETVSDTISLQYQAVGGDYSQSMTAIVQMLDNLALDNRPVSWPSIIDKPSEFPPSHHLHDIGDVYGFEYVVHALDRIRQAIEMGDSASHDAIYRYVDNKLAAAQVANQAAIATAVGQASESAGADEGMLMFLANT